MDFYLKKHVKSNKTRESNRKTKEYEKRLRTDEYLINVYTTAKEKRIAKEKRCKQNQTYCRRDNEYSRTYQPMNAYDKQEYVVLSKNQGHTTFISCQCGDLCCAYCHGWY